MSLISRIPDDKKMRLKFLFFPIILVISLSIFIGYIWPEISNVKSVNAEKIANTQSLQDIKDKQSAIELIGTQIANDNDSKTMVYNYLPNKKVEERIIGGVNYLAVDSGVSLVNISLRNLDVPNPANTAQQNAALANKPADNADVLQFSEATISISGDYEKIKLFINQLQKIALFNNIKSLVISNKEKSSSNTTDANSSSSSTLFADMVVNFGYLSSSELNNNKITNLKPELDSDTIGVLKQYISQKTESMASMISNVGNKGKANPFLP